MKKPLIRLLLLALAVLVGYIVRASMTDLPRPRFELLLFEKNPTLSDTGSNIYQWEVWHDKETGQEIVCPLGVKEASCYLTGRSWKDAK